MRKIKLVEKDYRHVNSCVPRYGAGDFHMDIVYSADKGCYYINAKSCGGVMCNFMINITGQSNVTSEVIEYTLETAYNKVIRYIGRYSGPMEKLIEKKNGMYDLLMGIISTINSPLTLRDDEGFVLLRRRSFFTSLKSAARRDYKNPDRNLPSRNTIDAYGVSDGDVDIIALIYGVQAMLDRVDVTYNPSIKYACWNNYGHYDDILTSFSTTDSAKAMISGMSDFGFDDTQKRNLLQELNATNILIGTGGPSNRDWPRDEDEF